MPLAPKAPDRPKAAQRHPLPHQRLRRTFGYHWYSEWVFSPLVSPSIYFETRERGDGERPSPMVRSFSLGARGLQMPP